MHVVLAGGGTAGHIEPALALADALRRHDPTIAITALGTERGLETRLVPARGYELALIPAVPLPRRPSRDLLSLPKRIRAAVQAVTDVFEATNADVLVGFGGYVALPAYLAARRAKLPYVVHEANMRPGLANRVGARGTRYVAVASPSISLPHAQHVGIPIRAAISGLNRADAKAGARAHFGLQPDLPTLLVTGGSQGARHVNDAVSAAGGALAEAGIQVLHHTGAANIVDVSRTDGQPPYVTVPYIERMDLAYAAADLAICRAGAMTCAELTAVGLPAVFVPLPIGNGEQRLNAEPIVAAGGGLIVDDDAFSSDYVRTEVISLIADSARLQRASLAAASLGRADADQKLLDMVLRAAATQPVGESS